MQLEHMFIQDRSRQYKSTVICQSSVRGKQRLVSVAWRNGQWQTLVHQRKQWELSVVRAEHTLTTGADTGDHCCWVIVSAKGHSSAGSWWQRWRRRWWRFKYENYDGDGDYGRKGCHGIWVAPCVLYFGTVAHWHLCTMGQVYIVFGGAPIPSMAIC